MVSIGPNIPSSHDFYQSEFFQRSIQYVICAVAIVAGALLCFVGKKFMRVIIALLAGIAACFGVLKGFRVLENHGYGPANIYVQYSVIVACGIIAIFLGFRWFAIKAGLGALGAMGFIFGTIVILRIIDGSHPIPHGEIVTIASCIVAGLVGTLFGIVFSKPTMKVIGATLGPFFVVTSIGFFIDAVINNAAKFDTKINLWKIIMFMKGQVNQQQNTLPAAVGAVQYEYRKVNKTDIVMLVAMAILSIASLIYQFGFQKKKQNENSKVNQNNLSQQINQV